MKNLFVIFATRFDRKAPSLEDRRNESFGRFSEIGRKEGFNVLFSRFNYLDLKKRKLSLAWSYDGGWRKARDKKVNVIYYRGMNKDAHFIGQKISDSKIPMTNRPELEVLCDDKFFTSVVFPDLMPRTFLINDHYELHKALKFIRTEKVVLKPRYGSYGRNVIIIDKNLLKNGIKKDTLVQEFVDSSSGVKKLDINSYHDLRVVVVDGKIDHSYARIPKEGKMICNMAYGAEKKFYPKSKLPKKVVKDIKEIDAKLKKYDSRIYSADFCMNKGEPFLIEMNSKPNTSYYDGAEKIRDRYHRNMFRSLEKTL